MDKTIQTLAEFEAEAVRFAGELAPREQGATLVTLSGGLGVGKTAFTKAVARTFGVEDIVTSPTFVLEKVYPLTNQSFKTLIHIDAYRLEKGADLAPLDFDALMKDPGNVIFLEWPERVMDALPVPTRSISFVAHANTSRTISYV
jgi:tRNA threonylcarbamoyladenosine biosynthesis protein TsaE